MISTYMCVLCVYIYIYREREMHTHISLSLYMYVLNGKRYEAGNDIGLR